jgi:hypothetical protein
MSEKTKLQSRKEREKKPWLSEIYRRFGTPIGPLRDPIHLSMDGRLVGTSLNNISVLRPPDFRVFSVEDAMRQKQVQENQRDMRINPLYTNRNVTVRSPSVNTIRSPSVNTIRSPSVNTVRKRPTPKRFGTKKNTNASPGRNIPEPKKIGPNPIKSHPVKPRPAPKRIGKGPKVRP